MTARLSNGNGEKMAVSKSPKRRTKSKSSDRSLGNVDTNLKRSAKRYDKDPWVGSIPDGESVILRMVDVGKDFIDGFVHEVPMKGRKGKAYTKNIWCLDQNDEGKPCPGCADDHDRKYKFWCRVIHRDAPKENAKGKIVGYEDRVEIWSSGSKRLLKAIQKAYKKYDLADHDIEVEREGEDYDTTYDVTVLDPEDPQPLTKAEKKLVANSKIDLKKYTTPPEFDEYYGKNEDDDDDDVGAKSQRRGSAFGSRKKKPRDDDDDDETPRRNKKSKGSLAMKSSSKRRRK
jgi:hypothetical protein